MRVRTDVAALPKLLDYRVPDTWSHPVVVGTRVRMPLHGRSVTGWVVEDDVEPEPGLDVLPLKSWLGWGPPPAVIELADWAAWRWAGSPSFFLRTGSPDRLVRALPPSVPSPAATSLIEPSVPSSDPWWAAALHPDQAPRPAVLQLPPANDVLDLVLATIDRAAATPGSVLVLAPSVGWASRLTARLQRRGYAATTDWREARAGWPVVVGSRAAAWAPVPQLAAAVVLDAHDSAYREESAPTYSAVDVVIERLRRVGRPCLLVSPVPPPTLTVGGSVAAPPTVVERAGWAAVEAVDRRGADPREGLFSESFVRLARQILAERSETRPEGGLSDSPAPLVCVYDRTGGARLLACARCGEVARCDRCGAAVSAAADRFSCPRCGEERPQVCAACGRLKMRTLRMGVSRMKDELSALLGVAVTEIAGPAQPRAQRPEADASDGATENVTRTPVVLGTKAALYRVRRATAVVFLDFDLHLLAPRLDAVDEALDLLVRATRMVGPRGDRGPKSQRILLQTRVPDHPVVSAAVSGSPGEVLLAEVTLRQASGLPPFAALARITGALAPSYAAALRTALVERATEAPSASIVAVDEVAADTFLLRAPDHAPLCDLLAAVPRPPGRGLRIEVDPSSP